MTDLTEAQVSALQSSMESVMFAPRSVLFRQGTLSSTVFIIASGRVRLSIISEAGDEFSPNLVEEGGLLGLAAALLHRPRSVSATAVGPVHARTVSVETIEAYMMQVPVFGRNIARLLAKFTVEHVARSGFLVSGASTPLFPGSQIHG